MNINKIRILTTVFFLSFAFTSFAQTTDVIIPGFNDKYVEFVKQLEQGNTKIDYVEFRNSFLDSKQFNVKSKRKPEYDSLQKEIYIAIKKKDYQQVIKVTKAMLSIDYTSMLAHKYLQQTYRIMGDTANKNKYRDIEFGLLHSIIDNGDGGTCETAFPVIQVEEEYFVLDMLDADFKKQSIDKSANHICDKMEVKIQNGDEIFYFNVSKIFEKYQKKNN
jgi:hypothetical protein